MNVAYSSTDVTDLNISPVVLSNVNYLGSMDVRPVFYSERYDRNKLVLKPHNVEILNARSGIEDI